MSVIFEPLQLGPLDGQEPHLPLEPRVAAGTTTTARGPPSGSTGTSSSRAAGSARSSPRTRRSIPRGLIVPGLRAHRPRRPDSVLPRARQAGARARLQVHRPARTTRAGSATSATSSSRRAVSSTDKPEPVHGFPCERLSVAGIRELVDAFAQGARRAREAGADGVEIAGGNGVPDHAVPLLGDQRSQGRVRRVAREPRALRARDRARRSARGRVRLLPRQFKISVEERMNEIFPWLRRGNRSRSPCRSASGSRRRASTRFHISAGGAFPHPRNPPGGCRSKDS